MEIYILITLIFLVALVVMLSDGSMLTYLVVEAKSLVRYLQENQMIELVMRVKQSINQQFQDWVRSKQSWIPSLIRQRMAMAMLLFPPLMVVGYTLTCLLYTSPSPRDRTRSRMPSSA